MNTNPTAIAFGFRLSAFSLLCVFILLSGCATIPSVSELRASLSEKAAAYWNLRFEARYGETYKMESAEALMPFDKYLEKVAAMKKFNIISHSIKDVETDGLKGTIELEISYVLPRTTKPFKQVLHDEWVFRNGQWLHLLPK